MILAIDIGAATFGWSVITKSGRVTALGAEELPKLAGEGTVAAHQRRLWHQGRVHQRTMATCPVQLVVAEEVVLSPKGIAGVAGASMCGGMLEGLCLARNVPLYASRPKQWQGAILKPPPTKRGRDKRDKAKAKAEYEEELYGKVIGHVERWGSAEAIATLGRMDISVSYHAMDAVGLGVYAAMRFQELRLISADIATSAIIGS